MRKETGEENLKNIPILQDAVKCLERVRMLAVPFPELTLLVP